MRGYSPSMDIITLKTRSLAPCIPGTDSCLENTRNPNEKHVPSFFMLQFLKCNILLIYSLENKHVLRKIVVGKFISFWDGPLFEDIRSFSGGVFDLLLPQAVCHFRLALTDVGRRVRHRNGNISSDRLPSQAGSHRIPRCQNPERETEREKKTQVFHPVYIYI